MKTVLYYFSGTGNSLQVARDLAGRLGETQVISIPKAGTDGGAIAAGRIGVVYPVYMFGMPLVVAKFLKELPVPPETYIFAVATAGGAAGAALAQTAHLLEKRGLRLAAGFPIIMPGNYTPLYGAIPQEKQQRMFGEEQKIVQHIAGIVKEKKTRRISSGPWFKNALLSGIHKLASPKIPRMDKGFWSNESCNSCGVCARVCPVNNIEIADGKPRWLNRCEQCFACLHWCPEQSIQYKKSTIGRKRYHHPQIAVQDIIAGARAK